MEQKLLDAYRLRTLDPQDWEQDTVTANEDNLLLDSLDKGNMKSHVLLDLVNKDSNPELLTNPEDPLDPRKKVVHVLKERNIPVNNQDVLRFSIGSKQFNSKQFLKFVHKEDSFEQLQDSLSTLEESITQTNDELRKSVEKEYLKLVRSKSSLDTVLSQFQKNGFKDEDDGIKNLKVNINDANKQSALLIKPIIFNKQKEIKLKQSLEFIEKKKFFFDLPKSLKTYIADNDYENLVHDYRIAKQMKEDDNSKIISKIWEHVEAIIDSYKTKLWGKLNNDNSINDEFLKTIRKLIELDAIDNPIFEWIEIRSNGVLTKFNETFSKFHDKILNVQLNILSTVHQQDYSNFKSILNGGNQLLDSSVVVEMWLIISKLFESLNAMSQEFIEFWRHVNNFIDGTYSQRLVSNYIDSSSSFLNFEKYEIEDIKAKGEAFINHFLHKIIRFFTSTQDTLKSLHSNDTTINDGSVDAFGFLPPLTNSLSSLKYLPQLYTTVTKILSDLGQLVITDNTTEELRGSSALIQERIVSAVCAVWLNDCQSFHRLEDWQRLETGETAIPDLIYDFEVYIIERLGNLLFGKLPDANVVQIARYPSKKILTGVQIQFLRSFDILLESIIKKIIEENHNLTMSKESKNHHKLLTLFNIKKLTTKVVPAVIGRFDKVFDTKLQSENLEIHTILENIEQTIFDSFMNEQRRHLSTILVESVSSIKWDGSSAKGTKVSSYVYEILNVLIGAYTSVLSVSPELIDKVFKSLLEHTSATLLKNYREITRFSDDGLKQIVLDVEFFKSLVGKSTNDTVSRNFKLVYKSLDDAQLDFRKAYDEIGQTLDEALEASSIEYEIFNS